MNTGLFCIITVIVSEMRVFIQPLGINLLAVFP